MPNTIPPTQPPTPQLTMSRDEAAEALGISLRQVDHLLADTTVQFPCVRIGRRVLIPIDELRRWLADQVETNEDVPQ